MGTVVAPAPEITVSVPASAVGVSTGTITIGSDDAAETSFTFRVRAKALANGQAEVYVGADDREYLNESFEEVYFGRAELGGSGGDGISDANAIFGQVRLIPILD